jgi:hypothetical protein
MDTESKNLINVEFDCSAVVERLKHIPGDIIPVLKYSVGKALSAGRTAVSKYIRNMFNAPAKAIKAQVHRSTIRDTAEGVEGTMTISGPGVPAYLFPHKDVYPEGVEVQFQKGISERIREAFSVRHPSQMNRNIRVLERTQQQLPLYLAAMLERGPSVSEMLNEPQVRDKVQARIEEALHKNLNATIDGVLNGYAEVRNGKVRRVRGAE